MKKFGIDISKWQGDFNFDKAIAEGVEFAIIKGGGGDDGLYKDIKFERNYKEAKAKGLPVGCYWFSKATSIIEAENEARYFYQEILQGKQFELPIYIDVEDHRMLDLGKEKLTEIIKVFCDYLESKRYFVGIYSSLSYFNSHVNDAELQKYTHWVAQWATECNYNNKNILGMWQFGGETNLIRTNKVAGVTCDQNYMLQNFPEIIKSGGFNGFETSKKEEVKSKTNSEIADEVIEGKWGNGAERFTRLSNAGYDYSAVQSIVDQKIQNRGIREGDRVYLNKNAVVFGKKTRFLPFVYDSVLWVRELNGNRAVISTDEEGKITGAVDIKYLKKV